MVGASEGGREGMINTGRYGGDSFVLAMSCDGDKARKKKKEKKRDHTVI